MTPFPDPPPSAAAFAKSLAEAWTLIETKGCGPQAAHAIGRLPFPDEWDLRYRRTVTVPATSRRM